MVFIKNISVLLLVGLFAFSCCKKDNPTSSSNPSSLPPYTETGANTLGFKVDGKIWLPKAQPFGTSPLFADYDNGTFYLKSSNETDYFSIEIYNKIYSIGTYVLIYKIDSIYTCFERENDPYCYYRTDSLNTGLLNINKLDTLNKIVAGTFELNMIGQNQEKLKITEGRFDVKY